MVVRTEQLEAMNDITFSTTKGWYAVMNQINLDPTDQASMNMLMDEHGDSKTMYPGTNEYGEDVYISIFHDKIVTSTTQSNGWIRNNIYWNAGRALTIAPMSGRTRSASLMSTRSTARRTTSPTASLRRTRCSFATCTRS